VIVQQVQVPIPPGAPPGEYRLRVGLFDPGSGQRLSRLSEVGSYQGDTYLIEDVSVVAGAPPGVLPEPPFPVNQTAVSGLRLLGYERGGTTAATGDSLNVALWWLAERPLPPMQRQLVLTSRDVERVLLTEGDPVNGTYPFAAWPTPQFVIDRQTVRIPDDLPTGAYRRALRVLGDRQEPLYALDLGLLRTEETERVYSAPAVENQVDANFGDEIALVGYNLVANNQTNDHTLTLVWQAERQPTNAYTVFVHLLYPDGTCCVWQQDMMPRQNSYPTDHWLPNEVVEDSYQLDLRSDLPAGEYPLEVGLYLPETGQRLSVIQGEQSNTDALLLRPLVVAP
jgi:hypothetical protein